MYKLTYSIGGVVQESYHLPNWALACWKKRQLKQTGRYELGTFKIEFV